MRPEEESICRCCKCCKDWSEFQKIIKLKKTGLILYRYSSRVKHISRKIKPQDETDNANDEVLIIHNVTDRDLSKDKYMPEFEQSIIKCPRCKYIFDHAKKLLENVNYIHKFGIISFCEYCQNKDRKKLPCNHCREVVNKFFDNQGQKIKSENILCQKINKTPIKIMPRHIQSCSLSDLHLTKQYHGVWSPKSFHHPRIDQLVDLFNLTDQGRDGHLKKKIYHSDDNLNLMDQSDISMSRKKHLRFSSGMIRSSQSLIDINLNDLKPKNILHRKYISYPSSYFDDKISEDLSIYKSFNYDIPEKSMPSHSHTITHAVKEDLKHQRTSEREVLPDLKDMITASDRAVVNFDAVVAQRRLDKDFSFFFVKKPDDEHTLPRKSKSSSELIKDTQNMIREREKREEERQKENEKKRLELEQKKLEKQKEKKLLEEKKEKEKRDKEKKEEPKEEKVADKDKEKSLVDKSSQKSKEQSKTSLATSKKDKVNKPKSESKKNIAQHEPKDKESIKVQKETEKVKKEEKSQKDNKEQKIKEKEVKESVKKDNKEKEPRKEKDQKTAEKGTGKEDLQEDFKKMLAEQKKQKEEEAKLKQKLEEEAKLKRKLEEENKKKLEAAAKAEKIPKPEPESKNVKESKKDQKSSPKTKTDATVEQGGEKELDFKQIAIRKPSCDDLILRLVKLKQSEPRDLKIRPTRLSEINIKALAVAAHKGHNKKRSDCKICNDSELELDIENILMDKTDTEDMAEIIIGQKILKFKPPLEEKIQDNTKAPILFTSTFQDDIVTNGAMGDVQKKNIPVRKVEQVEVPKGVIRYTLSDRSFIDKGWTMLPTEKVVRKMNVYRMRPAHPEFDWFEHNKNKKLMTYDTGEKLAEFDDNGRGRWFYRNGRLALDYYDAEEINAQQRFVIYSSGEPDERGCSRPLAILATFDYLGNGIVFDHAGKIRLKYNQTEGVVLDRGIGPVSHWKWHTLNDPPVLQQIMIDTQMAHKDPDIYKLGGPGEDKPRPDNEEMLAIEFDNFIKEKSKKLSQKFKPFQIKMKALKINEHFSLKVLDQATVYLIFRDGSTNLKINIGMILDHQEIVDTDTAEVGEVSNSLERFPARTDSLAGLQKSVAYAQRVERSRVERERRLRPVKASASVDKLNAMVSKPLRTPLHTVPSSSTAATTSFNCRCRKPASCNLYYDARLT